MIPSFEEWWKNIGSAMPPLDGEDREEHAKRVACAAWFGLLTHYVNRCSELEQQRNTAWEELSAIRKGISANPEESTLDEVHRLFGQSSRGYKIFNNNTVVFDLGHGLKLFLSEDGPWIEFYSGGKFYSYQPQSLSRDSNRSRFTLESWAQDRMADREKILKSVFEKEAESES
jgi:hypothetical protein